eukprot:m.221498 g.221498  ORF g.221498 m.221498 type:complete len:464 (-) comp33350_c0_seq4:44-1435(-)
MTTPKKVLVSGCFDLLHSGHVEFFQQAAEHGDLYVRIGTDANIKALKGHTTMYTDSERLFMVQNIKCVHDAALSSGTGVYDFEEDMKTIKPDIYFVNDDASKLEGRVELCKTLGIDMVVAPRKPAEGLEVRSSTSMKARLREIIVKEREEEELNRQSKEIEAFNETIPWRFCFAGGWMDLKWCNELYPGCAITINFKFDPLICKDQCGLATSSRKHAIKLWNGVVPKYLSCVNAAEYLWGAENFDAFGNETKPYIGGSQDQCGLFFPGVSKVCYNGAHWPKHLINLNDPTDPKQAAVFKWLEDVLYIVEIPFVSRPDDYSSQKINHLKDPKVAREKKVAMVKALADASEHAWNAICAMDIDALGAALSATMTAWGVMLPYTVDPYQPMEGFAGDPVKSKELHDFWSKYDAPHTKGCLFSGAGGGFLMVINDKPVENGLKIVINHKHFAQPFPSDKFGAEPRAL